MLLTTKEIASHERVTGALLLDERGGEWLGIMRNHIQRTARNGSNVTWCSQEIVDLQEHTVRDLEILAGEIAAAAINQVREEIKDYITRMKVSGTLPMEVLGATPSLVTHVEILEDGSLDHRFCVGAHSWIYGKRMFGQGIFATSGVWEHPCAACCAEHDAQQTTVQN